MAANTTVFEAFPNALDEWFIGEVKYSTITGNKTAEWQSIDVLVDEGNAQDQNRGNTAAMAESDTLIYAQPSQLPTLDTAALIAAYMVKDEYGKTYTITDAGIGKNQHTGQIEHVELRLHQVEASDGE